MFKEGSLQGKRILVTGGGTGLGKEMASMYASLGADLFLCGRRKDVVENAAAELARQHGVKVRAFELDIRNPEAVDAVVEEIWKDGGALDGLLNNAAGNFISRTEDLSHRGFDARQHRHAWDLHVTHSVGKRWVAEARAAASRGEEVPVRNVVSILVTWVQRGPFVVPSAMAKSAIANATKSLAPSGTLRHPPQRLRRASPDGRDERSPSPGKKTSGREEQNPMQRVGRMSELANLATFLMADGVDWLTGQIITIDGGNSLATGGNFYAYRANDDDDWARIRESIRAQDNKDKQQR
jgi:NAD(P)-dependent dehydrogenase (short-subunit alcohol dehydrogenase family)